ncbi:hypothetical protein [Bacillus cereus group sp. N21]|uniref:hypothetical protein n=1 Tax=Bacillus cereus group sp. N21 TaxID=2794591 RepID=UPI0018F77B63|nr:hypothetical protein [Bacillus cereus group sp. N21]MBJ8031044.1 hypothetical protein [Bacillus cereus group sp. N21]
MAKVTVELTEKQVEFLKLFNKKQHSGADDNRCTCDALHVVQKKRNRFIPYSEDISAYFDPDHLKFCVDEDHESWNDEETEAIREHYEWIEEECPIEIKPFDDLRFERVIGTDGEERFIGDFDDYFKHYGIENYDMAWVEKEWENVAFFFILDEAKQYQKYQAHNLGKSRIYTYSAGYDNRGDFTHFRDLLMQMGQELNKESQQKEEAAV